MPARGLRVPADGRQAPLREPAVPGRERPGPASGQVRGGLAPELPPPLGLVQPPRLVPPPVPGQERVSGPTLEMEPGPTLPPLARLPPAPGLGLAPRRGRGPEQQGPVRAGEEQWLSPRRRLSRQQPLRPRPPPQQLRRAPALAPEAERPPVPGA